MTRVYLFSISIPLVCLFLRLIDLIEMYGEQKKHRFFYISIIVIAILFNGLFFINSLSYCFIFIWNGLFVFVFPFLILWNRFVSKKINNNPKEYVELVGNKPFMQALKLIIGICFLLVPFLLIYRIYIQCKRLIVGTPTF